MDYLANSRKNAVNEWSSGMDRQAAYEAAIKNKNNKHHVTYVPGQFTYEYNSMGIRCDELKPQNVEILYAGCSFTEGEALPREHVWAHFLNKIIEERHGKELGYHNVARGGASISAITRYVYHAIEVLKLRPKMVIVLFPSIFRTEFYSTNLPQQGSSGPMAFIQGYIDPGVSRSTKYFYENHEKNIRIINSMNELYRNAILLNALCQQYGIEFRFETWHHTMHTDELFDSDLTALPQKYLLGDKRDILNIGLMVKDGMPKNLRDKYLDIRWPSLEEAPQVMKYTIARDFAHPGPNPHLGFASNVYNKIRPTLNKIYDQSNKH